MDTLPHYSALLANLNEMKSRLNTLKYEFKEIAARTTLDDQLIDALVASATAMISDANDLKSIAYDPTSDSD